MAFMQSKKDKFQGTQQKSNIPDGEHLVRVRGMRRTELKSGAGIVNIDVEIVRSKVDGVEVNTFAGREFDLRYFLPVDNEELFDQTFERLVDRDLKHFLGKVPEGDFTDDLVFEQWSKAVLGRGAWLNRQTSEKVDKNGAPYVNHWVNKGAEVPARSSGANKPQAANAGSHPAQAAQAPQASSQAANSSDDDDDIPF